VSNIFEKNTLIWEKLYSSGQSNLMYPNEMLVRLFNRYKNERHINTVLDYGFGSGANLIHFVEKGCDVHGVEVSESALQIVKTKLKDKNITANINIIKDGKIPYEDNFFDLVVAWQVLYYNDLESFNQTMDEISRVLKKGGLFIGTMAAIQDYSHELSNKIGDYLYSSNVPSQKGATCIILDKEDLPTFFPGKKLSVGEYYFNFDGVTSRHWVVVYED